MIFLAAAIALGAPPLRGLPESSPGRPGDSLGPALATTANVRVRPEASAPVVAVLPAGRRPRIEGRLADGEWLVVRFGPAEGDRGWLPADRLGLEPRALAALAPVAAPEAVPAVEAAAGALPDLTIASVFLMRDGHLALDIRNDGEGPLTDTKIPVLITRASGETVGVLEVGPATLAPRGTATVVTPVVVTSTGTYTLQLDRQESIIEAARNNNSATKLLVTGGG